MSFGLCLIEFSGLVMCPICRVSSLGVYLAGDDTTPGRCGQLLGWKKAIYM